METSIIYQTSNTTVSVYRNANGIAMVCKKITFVDEDDAHARAWNELRILNMLPYHERIVQPHSWEKDYLCIRINTVYAGRSLIDILQDSFEVLNTRNVMAQIASGLQHLKIHQIAHRDIKLDNIVWMNGIVKLIDFGFAFHYTCQHLCEVCLTEQCGTWQYTCPEIVDNIPYSGFQADVWSCGIVFFAIVFRSFPFRIASATQDDVFRSVCTVQYKGGSLVAFLSHVYKKGDWVRSPYAPILDDMIHVTARCNIEKTCEYLDDESNFCMPIENGDGA
jgi:serine/threonine protein kinase